MAAAAAASNFYDRQRHRWHQTWIGRPRGAQSSSTGNGQCELIPQRRGPDAENQYVRRHRITWNRSGMTIFFSFFMFATRADDEGGEVDVSETVFRRSPQAPAQ